MKQRGFTLIEVAVAFAIFALMIGALLEAFSGSVRRTQSTRDAEASWMTAQSLLAEQRVREMPWSPEQSGRTDDGRVWRIEVAPIDAGTDPEYPWRAYAVTVSVQGVVLKSVELARSVP
jgi:type II secretion system protein I